MGKNQLAFWFEELGQKDNDLVGKKGANLGEMVKLGMPVAPGFAISLDGCRRFLSGSGAGEAISRYLENLGEIKNVTMCDEASRVIRSIIEEKELLDMRSEISSFYRQLCKKAGMTDVPVSVRSSGVTSRPGMFDTLLNVRGETEVLQAIKKVWASMFSSRALWFRQVHAISHEADVLGIVVQKLVNARAAGVTFTADPVTGNRLRIIMEATWGLGEGVVSNKVQVDRFVISKESLELIEKVIGDKTFCMVCGKEGDIEEKDIPADKRLHECLSEEEVKAVAGLSKSLEEFLGQPQDIEWAIDPDLPFPNNIFLFQTRPVKMAAIKSTTDKIIDRLLSSMRSGVSIGCSKIVA